MDNIKHIQLARTVEPSNRVCVLIISEDASSCFIFAEETLGNEDFSLRFETEKACIPGDPGDRANDRFTIVCNTNSESMSVFLGRGCRGEKGEGVGGHIREGATDQ